MKQISVMTILAISLSACVTNQEAPAPIKAAKPAPATIQTAKPAQTVDCTGLSDAECQYKIENYGNPNPPPMRGPYDVDPVPVEPVDVEPMGDIISPS